MLYLEPFFDLLQDRPVHHRRRLCHAAAHPGGCPGQGWMTAEELVNFIAVSESTPGPFAVNVSTYVGAELAGLPGAFCATLGVVLPSFLIILLVARFYAAFRSSAIVSGAMGGLRPAVIGMIGAAVVSVGQTVFLPEGLAAVTAYPLVCSLAIFALMRS